MKKRIIFTGGGSGGHVVPALTIINKLKKKECFDLYYIGGRKSIERELVGRVGIKYFPIFTGKLRRYISFENFVDIFKLKMGILQSLFILIRFRKKNTLVFSTGGFVSVPVVLAAWITRKKIYLHEQTTRAGLANKICSKFATKIFLSFEESLKFFQKGEFTGYPVRDECLSDEIGKVKLNGIDLNSTAKPILFVTGGGNGAKLLNELIKSNLEKLKNEYIVVHQVGKHFIDEYQGFNDSNYIALDFVGSEMVDLMKLAKVVISRAGAGTVCELMALEKASIFIPLKIAQKNEQYHNAMAAKQKVGAIVIEENALSSIDLFEELAKIGEQSLTSKSLDQNPTNLLVSKIEEAFS